MIQIFDLGPNLPIFFIRFERLRWLRVVTQVTLSVMLPLLPIRYRLRDLRNRLREHKTR